MLRSLAELMGRGRQGSLYKVKLSSGVTLTVKIIQDWDILRDDFKKRVHRIDQVKHSNVMPVIAYYRSRQEQLLVYEFQKNGSLFRILHGDKYSTDWDKAWSSFKKQGRKTFFSQFSPNKYVSWNPRRSEFPLSEEVDPIKRTERSNLTLWTSPSFTLVGAIVIVTFLIIYTILAPVK
ncbi:uncharacterized protein LOC111404100 [Olea europaea subsp. europaea]|uniref:Uncharacterized protein LOC111404100 n=1 Tax=Olea europaea subsp. europaea TaxID=158383 RepID=A0A8S0QYQ8_OLEEU|nr:uncharacterized protein LOC111404100 [Olea europaea subsp. europaea]